MTIVLGIVGSCLMVDRLANIRLSTEPGETYHSDPDMKTPCINGTVAFSDICKLQKYGDKVYALYGVKSRAGDLVLTWMNTFERNIAMYTKLKADIYGAYTMPPGDNGGFVEISPDGGLIDGYVFTSGKIDIAALKTGAVSDIPKTNLTVNIFQKTYSTNTFCACIAAYMFENMHGGNTVGRGLDGYHVEHHEFHIPHEDCVNIHNALLNKDAPRSELVSLAFSDHDKYIEHYKLADGWRDHGEYTPEEFLRNKPAVVKTEETVNSKADVTVPSKSD